MLKIGTKVRIKTWKEMDQTYGLTPLGEIDAPYTVCQFLEDREKFCGKIFTIDSVREPDPILCPEYSYGFVEVPEHFYDGKRYFSNHAFDVIEDL